MYGACDNRARDTQGGACADESTRPYQQTPFSALAQTTHDFGTHRPAQPGHHFSSPGVANPDASNRLPPLRNDGNNDALVIPQWPYAGNRCSADQPGAAALYESIPINVAASVALVPDALARELPDPLSCAFQDRGAKTRKGQKFTIRYVFQAADHKVLVNKNPAQIHEYLSGSQKSNAVTAAWNLQGEPPSKMTGKMVPHMRAALVEKVAATLRDFLRELKMQGTPLLFRGREVEYDHLLIVNISRPTAATVQPKLAILPRYRDLYLGDTRDSSL